MGLLLALAAAPRLARLARLLQQHLQVALVRLLLRYPRELWPDGHREVSDDADGGAAEVVRHMVVAARLGHLVGARAGP